LIRIYDYNVEKFLKQSHIYTQIYTHTNKLADGGEALFGRLALLGEILLFNSPPGGDAGGKISFLPSNDKNKRIQIK
jgi:hypothetical protein